MAIDKKLQIFDDEGNPVDYDILASDVKFNDGKDLPTKLAEMEEEIGEGGYTPPAGGIPKTDLAPSVQQTLDDVANKVDKVPGKGLSTNDYTTEDKTKLGDLPTADQLSQQMGSKANSSDLANYATKNELTSGLSGKQNTLTFDDAPGNTDNPVKSRGIKTAIEQVTPTINENGKWVIGGVATDKDAQGPRGNTVLVNENAVGIQGLIVNNVVDGGEEEILSAEMGKVIRQNIMKIFNALGTYAFPEGKPVLSWGSTVLHFGLSATLSNVKISSIKVDGVTQSYNSLSEIQITDGQSLEVTLGLPSNLYVIDDSTFSVKVSGNSLNTSVQGNSIVEDIDDAQVVISIAVVDGNVAINADGITYVGYGESNSPLAFMLDCKNRGLQTGHWIDCIGNIDFTLGSAVTAADSGVVFDGTLNSYGETDSLLSVAPATATVEAVVEGASGQYNPILVNPTGTASSSVGLVISTPANQPKMATMYLGYTGLPDPTVNCAAPTGNVNNFALSMNAQRYINKGVSIATSIKFAFFMNAAHTKLTIGRARRPDHSNDLAFIGTIKAIRVYNAVLTEAQQMQNWKVDQKRFNIS